MRSLKDFAMEPSMRLPATTRRTMPTKRNWNSIKRHLELLVSKPRSG